MDITKKELKKKNREGQANLILFIGACFIIFAIILEMISLEVYGGVAFMLSLSGTIMTFISNFLKNGYLKFFN
jgi:hypothetical protein